MRLDRALDFPDPSCADDDGLLAVGGDLAPERLVAAYSRGIFPWFSRGDPILWWCPPTRCLLDPDRIAVSRSLRQTIRQGRFEVRFDAAFEDVIRACATTKRRSGRGGTWITPSMMRAYSDLHARGLAHSVEAWQGGELAGGLYGVSLGGAFFGESMFHRASNASKVALVALAERLAAWGFTVLDCQIANDHLVSLGAYEVKRDEFLARLGAALAQPTRAGSWAA